MALSPPSRDPSWLSAEMKYVLEDQALAHGRYSKIYKAKETGSDKVLAVKVFNRLPETQRDSQRRIAIRHEASMLAAVRQGVSTTIEPLHNQTPPPRRSSNVFPKASVG
jgi:predicted Ser/Thr protein kinase